MTGGAGLSGSKGVPRGPPEWGEVLYEPQWARERRFEDRDDLVIGYVLVLVVVGFILSIVYDVVWVGSPLSETLVLLALVPIMALPILMTLGKAYKRMPFRIYEAGVTNYIVPMARGARREELLIPRERIRRVELHAVSQIAMSPSHMVVEYGGPDGDRRLLLTGSVVDDPLAVMMAFHRIVPDRLDEDAYDYMGVEDDGPVVRYPGEKGWQPRAVHWGYVFILGILVFFSVFIGALVVPIALARMTPLAGAVALLILGIADTFMTYMMVRMARSNLYGMVGNEMHVEGDRLEFPVNPWSASLLRVRRSLPLGEVTEVRKGLQSGLYVHVSRLTTLDGERLQTDVDVYQALRDREGWVRNGVVVENAHPGATPGGRLAVVDRWKAFGLFSILFLSALLSGCVAFLLRDLDISQPVSFELVIMVIFMGGTALMGFLLMLLIVIRSREARLIRSLFVSDKGISVPEARDDLRWIGVDEVQACRTSSTRWGVHIEVETGRGTLRLPMAAYEKLTEGGVSVEDTCGVLPVKEGGAEHP